MASVAMDGMDEEAVLDAVEEPVREGCMMSSTEVGRRERTVAGYADAGRCVSALSAKGDPWPLSRFTSPGLATCALPVSFKGAYDRRSGAGGEKVL